MDSLRTSLRSLLIAGAAGVALTVAGACAKPPTEPPPPLESRPASSEPEQPSAAVAEPAAPTDGAAPFTVVREAYAELTTRLFRRVEPRELLEPAWDAVRLEARRAGANTNAIDRYAAAGGDDIDGFVREAEAYLAGPGAALDGPRVARTVVRAMAAAIGDSHTRSLSPAQADSQRRESDGDTAYVGIGIRILPDPAGLIAIAEVFANSPAERAGLRAGDRIVGVDGTAMNGASTDAISARVRGPEGTSVLVTVQRAGEAFDIAVDRARILPPIVTGSRLEQGIGYLKVGSLPRRAGGVDVARDVDEQLRKLLADGARGLVLDLRGNPGGDPFTSVAVASNFIPSGTIFVTIDRDNRRTTYPAISRPTLFTGPLAVLIDRGSASGAEVVASALQEYGVGRLFGTQSCGCLSVGRPLRLGDTSGLIVTVEQAVTGKLGRSLEGNGIEPDELVRNTGRDSDRQLDAAVAYLRNALP